MAEPTEDGLPLRSSAILQEKIDPAQSESAPVFLMGDRITGRPDLETVIEGNAVLRKPGTEPAQRFPATSFARRGADFVYEGAGEHSVLRVVVREAVCRDAMTGGYYTLTASADWDGRKLSGCAYWGDLARPR